MDTGVKTVTVLGAGNGGCAAAADLTRRGFSVRLSSRSEHTIRPLWERGGIEYAGALGEGFAPIPVITQAARHLLFAAFPARETERLRALVAPVFPAIRPAANIVEQFYRMGYTTAEARDSGLAYEAFHQSAPDRWITAPASLQHRFLEQD